MNTIKIICASFICLLFLSVILMSNSSGEPNKNDINNLTYNDISYLWPVPKDSADIEKLLSANTVIGNTTIWPEESFKHVLNMAKDSLEHSDPSDTLNPRQIKFGYTSDSLLLKRENWKVVGFRIDPSAPSTDDKITTSFGIIPQIRLVLQPVIFEGGSVVVYDYAVHLPFSYTLSGDIKIPDSIYIPDTVAFKEILNDIIVLKKYLESTSKVPSEEVLQVNKGLANKVPGYAKKIEAFLSKHLPKGKLKFIAFMGLAPRPAPWIFFNMFTKYKFQILNTRNSSEMAGKPISPNRNWKDSTSVSTAILYQRDPRLDSPATSKEQTTLNKDIPNIIANPNFCNVFNTDCISCHSESTRRSILELEDNKNYKYSKKILVKKELLPTEKENVRNFGWFKKSIRTPAKPVISMRTANETANALKYIKKKYSTP